MSFILIAGSPTTPSRSSALLHEAGRQLTRGGHEVVRLDLRLLDPVALLRADTAHPTTARAVEQLAYARGVVIATPIYKAAYSGLLKLFIDLLAQTSLRGKSVLPIATCGSPHHMLALDYALRPVLHAAGADEVHPGIYATDGQVHALPEGGYSLAPELASRLFAAIEELQAAALPPGSHFGPVAFADVRMSS